MIKPVAIATVKATQECYFVYNIASYTTENKVYALYVNRAGQVVHCSCPDFKYRRRHDGCKHMRELQHQIDECKAAKEARKAVAEAEKIIAEQAKAAPVEAASTPASPVEVAQTAMTQAAEEVMFPKAKTTAVKRAPQFTNAQLAQLNSPVNRGFSLLKPAC